MAHIYRCSKCRTRNTFRHAVEWYTVKRKCRDCGHKHFYVDKERVYRVPCRCAGAYFWGAHRLGSLHCIHHPDHEHARAVRQGTHPGELAWDGVGLKPCTSDKPPF